MKRAVIDVGSNSVLLLIGEKTPSGWQTIHESTSVTALGEGTKATGLLRQDAMKRTLEALREMHEIAREQGAEAVVARATMAVRIARNASEFLAEAASQGTPVEVLSGDDEARLGFLAVANDPGLGATDRLSIIDPGGHSTELVTAVCEGGWQTKFSRSFPLGALGLRGEIEDERITGLDVLTLTSRVDDVLGFCYRPGMAGKTVVLGATGTNLVTIRERMDTWDPARVHGQALTYEEVGRAVGWLMPMSDAERGAIRGIEKGRERTLHFGALILERFMHAMRIDEVIVSVRGWRHALLEGSDVP